MNREIENTALGTRHQCSTCTNARQCTYYTSSSKFTLRGTVVVTAAAAVVHCGFLTLWFRSRIPGIIVELMILSLSGSLSLSLSLSRYKNCQKVIINGVLLGSRYK
jgi:hypothetical protein